MNEFLDTCVAGMNIGPTILLGVVLAYWVCVLSGVLGLDLLDFDLDMDGGGDVDFDIQPGAFESFLGMGVVVLRFLNIGRVPLMLWLSVFAISLWALTMFLDSPENHLSWRRDLLMLLFHSGVALVLTKGITEPLQGKFAPEEVPSVKELIGRECTVVTPSVTDELGQVRVPTDAAPLLLNARTKGAPLAKGDVAVIVEIDLAQGIYFVEKAQPEVHA